ncbi:MAG: protein kinase, partial [Firmicutes bacterium]|nr:protein kinase [Bacillota bacterium]
ADATVAKISDFGLAAATDGTRGKSVLAATYAFASPEQIRGEVLFESTDIFSWAVSVINMLLGTFSWQVGTAVSENFDTLITKSLVKVPPEVVKLLRRCTNKDPVRRIKNFDEVITVLEAWEDPQKKFKDDAVKKTDLATNRVIKFIRDSDFKNAIKACEDFFLRITETEKAVTYSVTRGSLASLTMAYFCALSKCQENSGINYKKVAKNWHRSPFAEFRHRNSTYYLLLERDLKAKKYLK